MAHAADMSAAGLFDVMKDVLDKFDLEMENIRGQDYGRYSTMSGCYAGVQARVREISSSASICVFLALLCPSPESRHCTHVFEKHNDSKLFCFYGQANFWPTLSQVHCKHLSKST